MDFIVASAWIIKAVLCAGWLSEGVGAVVDIGGVIDATKPGAERRQGARERSPGEKYLEICRCCYPLLRTPTREGINISCSDPWSMAQLLRIWKFADSRSCIAGDCRETMGLPTYLSVQMFRLAR